jgi:hypothetical protein
MMISLTVRECIDSNYRKYACSKHFLKYCDYKIHTSTDFTTLTQFKGESACDYSLRHLGTRNVRHKVYSMFPDIWKGL